LQRYLDQLDQIPLPNYVDGELDNKPRFQQIDHQGAYNNPGYFPFAEMSAPEHRLITAAYWAMCDLIDVQVGRMIDALERTGQLDNTIVIYMSDHGELLGDHGVYLKGPHFYEPSVHVPLIFSCPGTILEGQRSPALVELIDIAPTLLDAAGSTPYSGMQGRSLWPLLTDSADLSVHRDNVYCEYYNATRHPDAHATMVRTDRYKLVAYHGVREGELYDLEHDPPETHNRWQDPEYAAVKIDLLETLCERMAWTVDPLPLRQARY
jgi:arylsulfatase A-like enzyme